jgi:hypothetical protein
LTWVVGRYPLRSSYIPLPPLTTLAHFCDACRISDYPAGM